MPPLKVASFCRSFSKIGKIAKWLNARVCKTRDLLVFGGSNPSLPILKNAGLTEWLNVLDL